jgi:hypothetical protein
MINLHSKCERLLLFYVRILREHLITMWQPSGHRKPRVAMIVSAASTVSKVAIANMLIPHPLDGRTNTFHGTSISMRSKCCMTWLSVIHKGRLPNQIWRGMIATGLP